MGEWHRSFLDCSHIQNRLVYYFLYISRGDQTSLIQYSLALTSSISPFKLVLWLPSPTTIGQWRSWILPVTTGQQRFSVRYMLLFVTRYCGAKRY